MDDSNDLARYNQKRDFTKTKEPKGSLAPKKGFHYLIQKHAATRLHYDFRLELDGVLKSWAVTRGPSLDPGDKRLAIEVEDHPVAYGSFEGTIPKGQYGGGTVMLWDEGDWEPIGDPREGLKKGDLKFTLHGKRLHGSWALVRMRDREKDRHSDKGGRHNWLLIKHRDEAAVEGDGEAFLKANDTSVASGRTLDEIASGQHKEWVHGHAEEVPAAPRPALKKKAHAPKALDFIEPELATLADAIPLGEAWLHEVKFDGYRVIALIEDGAARLMTRSGLDWTEKFGSVVGLLKTFPATTAILDGEIVALNDKNVSSFAALQAALSSGQTGALQYYVFDLLHLNGEDWRDRPLIERKTRLHDLMNGVDFADRVIYSEHFTEDAEAFQGHMCRLDMEGVISKRADARYRSGRNGKWLKIKCHKRQEFVIGGFSESDAGRGFRSLLLGYYEGENLVYAGKVGTGFNDLTLRDIRKKLDGLTMQSVPFASVTADARRGSIWVKPKLVCEVEFTEWTPDGHLRHPSFQGLRSDKPAQEVARDRPMHVDQKDDTPVTTETKAKRKPKVKKSTETEVTGIRISHPDRIIFPDSSHTKLDLAHYYEAVEPILLPHVAKRPLSMLRCPEGLNGECFFQRHIAAGQSAHILDTGIPVKGRHEDYLMIEDVEGLISLVQWGVIELHPWGCMAAAPELPDKIIFDLDPDPGVSWTQVVDATFELKARMEEFGLTTFLKTTGGKGLHVVVPLKTKYGWPQIKAFARAIAESLESDKPNLYIAHASKADRKGKIFVDYLRNDLTATAVAPYAVRARPGAGVATPLFWDDLYAALKPTDYNIDTVPALVAKRLKNPITDPWHDFATTDQTLSADWLAALKIPTT